MSEINVNKTAEAAVLELLANVFGEIAYTGDDFVRDNVALACDGGMSEDDRTISVEKLDFLLNHFSVIYMGLVINKEFRDTFVKAVSVEIALDKKDEAFVKDIRNEMNEKITYDDSAKGNCVINLCRYDEELYKNINAKLSASFETMTKYDETSNELIEDMTDDDKTDVGFCVSNFMYLIRAFSQNNLFFDYTGMVIKGSAEKLGIECPADSCFDKIFDEAVKANAEHKCEELPEDEEFSDDFEIEDDDFYFEDDSEPNVNKKAEAATVKLLANVFNDIANMDCEVVRHNIELACEGGMSEYDRTISVEKVDFLLNRFSLIFINLVESENFRDIFMDTINAEISLNEKDEDYIKNMRNGMNLKPYEDSAKGNCVINLSHYNNELYKNIKGKLSKSCEMAIKCDDVIGDYIEELTEDDKTNIGFCVSNFMYLIRALSQNNLFFDYVVKTTKYCAGILGIEYPADSCFDKAL